jgi:hypothetical protein
MSGLNDGQSKIPSSDLVISMREALNQDREGLLSVTRLSLERARALRTDQAKLLHEEDMQLVVQTRSSRQDRVIKKHRNHEL